VKLAVAQIREDGGTQSRAQLNLDAVKAYAEAMRDGVTFPPVIVFYDGKDYWLADGFHRVAAAVDASITELEADVRQGTRRDAVLFSVGANAAHGVQRSNADKRRAVELLLNDDEWSTWADRKVAVACRVSHTFVAKLRPARVGTIPLQPGNVATVRPESAMGSRGNERPSLPREPMATVATPSPPPRHEDDELHLAGRLEDRLVALTTDICEASTRVRRLLGPALDASLRRLANVTKGAAA
jgi:ParB-like nuclease domain